MSSVARVIQFLREKGFSPKIRHYDDVIAIMMTSSKMFSYQQVYFMMVFHSVARNDPSLSPFLFFLSSILINSIFIFKV